MKSGDNKYKTILSDMFIRVCNKHKYTMDMTLQEKVKWVFNEAEIMVCVCNTKSERYILETFKLDSIDDVIRKIQEYITYCSDEDILKILIDQLQKFKLNKRKIKKNRQNARKIYEKMRKYRKKIQMFKFCIFF